MNILIFKHNGKVIWEKSVDNLELLAGLAAVSIRLTSEINKAYNTNYSFETSEDISHFSVLEGVTEPEISHFSCVNTNFKYKVWIKSLEDYQYNLYTFQTAAFLQGIISLATAFEMDFRSYIYQLPFDNSGKEYVLDGYVMQISGVAMDSPDLDDVDIEEVDDENIYMPIDPDRNEI
jgi:hypothetical protein